MCALATKDFIGNLLWGRSKSSRPVMNRSTTIKSDINWGALCHASCAEREYACVQAYLYMHVCVTRTLCLEQLFTITIAEIHLHSEDL